LYTPNKGGDKMKKKKKVSLDLEIKKISKAILKGSYPVPYGA